MQKKIVRTIIAISILIFVFTGVNVFGASQVVFPLPDNPTHAQIKATYYLNSDIFAEYAYVAHESPYKKYIEEIESEENFEEEYLLWKAYNLIECVFEDNPKEALFSEVGYYETMIFDAFYESLNKGAYMDDFDSMIKYGEAIIELDINTAFYTLGIDKPGRKEEISSNEMEQILSRMYYLGGSNYELVFKSEENFKEIMITANTIKSMSNRLVTIMSFVRIGESQVDVLKKMHEKCDDNAYLRLAISKMIGYYDSNYKADYERFNNLVDFSLDKLMKNANTSIWNQMVSELEGGYAELLHSVGKKALNAWFSTDKYWEAYHEMRALSELEDLMAEVSHAANGAYAKNPTDENATFYNSCLEATMNIYQLGLAYSEDYLSLLDDQGINYVAMALGYPGLNHSGLINEYKTQRNTMERQYVIAEAMIDEICAQNKDGYANVYDEPFELQGQNDFDVLCEVSIELAELLPEYNSKLYTSCDEEITATKNCEIGKANYSKLTVKNCALVVSGDLKMKQLYLDQGHLEVGGDCNVWAICEMKSDNDLLHVKGDFYVGHYLWKQVYFYTGHYNSEMTAGTIKLEGDLNFEAQNKDQNVSNRGKYGYYPKGTCKTVFCGTKLQTVRGSVDCYNIDLHNVCIENPKFTMEESSNDAPTMSLLGDTTILGNIYVESLDLNGYNLKTAGSVFCLYYLLNIGDTLIVGGDLVGGDLVLNNSQVEVSGNASFSEVVKMESETDLLHVKGDLLMGYSNDWIGYIPEDTNMTAGTVILEGNLQFRYMDYSTNYLGYYPEGTCKTVFCGTEVQTVKKGEYDVNDIGMVVNAQKKESNLKYTTDQVNNYIWDPEYNIGDRYIQLATITDNQASGYEYTGSEVVPDLTVKYGNILLEKGKDYTVKCTDNSQLGTATATVEGKGIYKGAKSCECKIIASDISKAKIDVVEDQVYTGSEITPSVSLSFDEVKLQEGIDYSISYENNTQVGTGQIIITGIGNFNGEKIVDFNIIPNDSIPEEEVKIDVLYNIEDIPTVFGEYYDAAEDAISVLPLTTSGILNNGKTVDIDITWTCDEYNKRLGTANTFKWILSSDTYKFNDTLKLDGEVSIINKAFSSVTIKAKDKTVEFCKTTDVAELFKIDANAGKATYSLISGGTGIGSIDGETLTVEKAGSFVIKVITEENGNYAASEAIATITVAKPKIIEVTKPQIGFDRLDSYHDTKESVIELLPTTVSVETEIETIEMDITWFCNEYVSKPKAENTFVWVINPEEYVDYDVNGMKMSGEIILLNKETVDISTAAITEVLSQYTYTGSKIKPIPVVSYEGTTLSEGADYTIEYENNTNVGTAKIKIEGIGNYEGTLVKEFTVAPQNISSGICTLSTTAYAYNGSVKTPKVTVKDSKGKTLVKDIDYTVSYASGRKAIGKYKVTVTGKGNYKGTKNLYFEIGPRNPSKVSVALYGHDDVKVSWSKVSGVSGYSVYYKKSTDSKWTYIKRTTLRSLKKSSLSDGAKYYFKVVPYKTISGNRCDSSGKTSSSIYTLKKLTGVKAAKSGTKVKVSWTNISGESGYQISQSTKKSGTKIVSTYKTTTGKSKTIKATKNKTYYYKVRAYKTVSGKKIYGPWSSAVKYKR